jgi:hypothetical protein
MAAPVLQLPLRQIPHFTGAAFFRRHRHTTFVAFVHCLTAFQYVEMDNSRQQLPLASRLSLVCMFVGGIIAMPCSNL